MPDSQEEIEESTSRLLEKYKQSLAEKKAHQDRIEELRMARKLWTVEQFEKAIKDSGGVMSLIAARIGGSPHFVKKFIMDHPELKELWDDERNKILDTAESVLYENIRLQAQRQQIDGAPVELHDVKWLLSRMGKDRGWSERQEVLHQGPASLAELMLKAMGPTGESVEIPEIRELTGGSSEDASEGPRALRGQDTEGEAVE